MKSNNQNTVNAVLFGTLFAEQTAGPNQDMKRDDLAVLIECLESEAVGKPDARDRKLADMTEKELPVKVVRKAYPSESETRSKWIDITITVKSKDGKSSATIEIGR